MNDSNYREYELSHHGILGQKWGVRRYQNPDGSLTDEGKKRYGSGNSLSDKDVANLLYKYDKHRSNSYQAAKLENKIKKFDKKYGVNSDKAAKLILERNTKIKDLTKEEIELGREGLKEDKKISKILAVTIPIATAAGTVAGGPFGGYFGATSAIMASYIGEAVVSGISGRSKELREIADSSMDAFIKKEAKNITTQQFAKEYSKKRQMESSNQQIQQQMMREAERQMQFQMQLQIQQQMMDQMNMMM